MNNEEIIKNFIITGEAIHKAISMNNEIEGLGAPDSVTVSATSADGKIIEITIAIKDGDTVEKEPVKIQPVKKWVKLHDKNPDTEGFYLVCDQYGEYEVAEYIPDIKSWFIHNIKGEIQYWISLPEPPMKVRK